MWLVECSLGSGDRKADGAMAFIYTVRIPFVPISPDFVLLLFGVSLGMEIIP